MLLLLYSQDVVLAVIPPAPKATSDGNDDARCVFVVGFFFGSLPNNMKKDTNFKNESSSLKYNESTVSS